MDWVTWKEKGTELARRYQYVLLVLLVGIFLMVFPGGKAREQAVEEPREIQQPDLQQSLSQLLSRAAGAGKVEVLLTESAGAQKLYQTDENMSADNVRRSTVLVTSASREEGGLVKQILPPTYQGAVVLCQGAEDARVRLAIVNAVMSVTGLRSDQITVLKMK